MDQINIQDLKQLLEKVFIIYELNELEVFNSMAFTTSRPSPHAPSYLITPHKLSKSAEDNLCPRAKPSQSIQRWYQKDVLVDQNRLDYFNQILDYQMINVFKRQYHCWL